MPALTSAQLDLLRGDDHRVEVYASFARPTLLWTARVNDGGIQREARTIAFDNGAGSFFGRVGPNQTVWIGSTAGAKDVGIARIRSISSGDGGVTGTLVVEANPWLWQNNQFLTFYHDYHMWADYSRIDDNEVFYKRYNITYSDQNENVWPVAIGGPNRAGFLVSGSVTWNIPIGDSYAMTPGASISSRNVTVVPSAGVTVGAFAGGVIPVTITLPGQYIATCTVQDSNGTDSQPRYVRLIAHSDNPSSPDYPTVVERLTVTGDFNRGGYQANVTVGDNATMADIPQRTAVTFWQRAYYGGVQQNVSIAPIGRNIILNGYVLSGNINVDPSEGSTFEFVVATIDELMRQHFLYSISLESKGSPTKWWHYRSQMSVGRILHHIYLWHSTLTYVADFLNLDSASSILRKYADMEKAGLYQMGDNLSRNQGIFAHIMCDKTGRLHMARDLVFRDDTARGNATVVATIDKADIDASRGQQMVIVERDFPDTNFVFVSGFTHPGGGADPTPIGSTAPATWPQPFGAKDRLVEKQVLSNQTHSNELSGQILAVDNNEFPEVRIPFAGNYWGALEPAYMEWWQINVAAGDSIRGIVWTDQKMIVRNISGEFIAATGEVRVKAIFETEVDGTDGVPYNFPGPTEFPDPGGQDPEIPTFVADAIMTGSSAYWLPGDSSTWVQRTANTIHDLVLDPFWKTKQSSNDANDAIVFSCETGQLRKTTDAGVSWNVVSLTNPPNAAGDSPAPTVGDLTFFEGHASRVNSGEFIFLARYQNAGSLWRSWILKTSNDFGAHTWEAVTESGCTPLLNAENDHTNTHNNPRSDIVALTSAKVAAAYIEFTTVFELRVVVGTVSGSTISWGTPVAQSSGTAGTSVYNMARLDDSQFALTYRSADDGSCDANGWNSVVVVTVVGTTPTFGVHYDNLSNCANFSSTSVGSLTSNKFIMGDTSNSRVRVCTVSGTGASATIAFGAWVSMGVGNASRRLDIKVLDAGFEEFVVSNGEYVRNGSVSGDVITWDGPAVEIDSANLDLGGGTIAVHSRTKFTVVYGWRDQGGASPPRELRARIGTISGGNISLSSAFANPYITPTVAITVTATGMTSDKFACTFSLQDEAVVRVTAGRSFADTVSWCVDAQQSSTQTNRFIGSDKLTDTTFVIHYEDAEVTPNLTALIADIGTENDIKLLGGSISNGLGTVLFVTGWSGAEQLFLQSYDIPTLALASDFYMGDTTEAELNALTYIAHPITPLIGIDDEVIIYGRLNDPTLQALGVWHVVYSFDRGLTLQVMASDWGTDYCSSMESDGFFMFAVRANASSAKLYEGIIGGTLGLKSTAPFTASVDFKAMGFDTEGNAILCAASSDAIMVAFTPPPFVRWYDITGNHPTSPGINSLVVVY